MMAAEKPSQEPPRRVLVIKPSSLGDVVTALPVLRGLRRTFGDVRISWLLGKRYVPVLEHDGDLDEIIVFDRKLLGRCWRSRRAAGALLRLIRTLRRGNFDWVIDLQGLFRSAFFAGATRAAVRAGFADAREAAEIFYTHRFDVSSPHTVDRNIELARRLGMDARPQDMTLQVPEAARAFAEEFRRARGLEKHGFIVCVPPTRWPNKLYPVRRWRQAVEQISTASPVVVLGAPGDRQLCAAIADGLGDSVMNAAGDTGVAEMVAVIADSAGVVCSDSAAKFIAAAVGVDCVVLFGPTRVDLTGPYLRGRAIVANVPCQGCLRRSCEHVTCMQLIDPGEVAAAAKAMLAAPGP